MTNKNWTDFHGDLDHIITLCAKLSSAVYCYRSCLCVGVFLCRSVAMITRNCVHRSSPNWVCW